MNDTKVLKELFARLFVMAIQNKINLSSLTCLLERSEFVQKIERGTYDDYFNRTLENVFFDITGKRVNEDDSYGVFNDAYWCGYSYFEMHLRTRKPFSYLFLKLPLVRLMNLYPVYHEMDVSSLLELFRQEESKETILRFLCEQRKTSLAKLSYATGIGLPTLSKYNASDEALYKASFQNIMTICRFFDAPTSLFLQRIPNGELNEKLIEIFGENYWGYYQNTRTACRSIVINDGEILLSYETKTDQWIIPGGGSEENESDKDCVIRETSEETGHLIEASDCVLEIDEYYENEKYISKYFLCKAVGKTNVSLTQREIEVGMEPRWISIEEALAIFSRHRDYADKDEMRRGLYLREYLALKRILRMV